MYKANRRKLDRLRDHKPKDWILTYATLSEKRYELQDKLKARGIKTSYGRIVTDVYAP